MTSLSCMELPIVFDCESIIESRKSIKESPDYFTFVTEYGDYEVDFQISFLLSKSIRDLLHSDKTCYKYEIPRNSCTEDFYKCFFASLSTNIINMQINLIKDFITISQILQFNCFQQSIEKAIISEIFGLHSASYELCPTFLTMNSIFPSLS